MPRSGWQKATRSFFLGVASKGSLAGAMAPLSLKHQSVFAKDPSHWILWVQIVECHRAWRKVQRRRLNLYSFSA